MKKITFLIIACLILATLLMVLLIGIPEKFDVDKSIESLKARGLTDGVSYQTEEELANATELANSEITYMGGDFTVEVTAYDHLIQDGDYSKSCTMITFASKKQATAYAELNMSYFAENPDNVWKVAQSGRVVVITNLEVAEEVIPLEFK